MIKYHSRSYPNHIKLHMQEVAGHFDIKEIYPRGKYCLHTEYSYGKRFQKKTTDIYIDLISLI